MWRRRVFLLILVLLTPAGGFAADNTPAKNEFFFKDGDTIVQIGDSITEQYLYSTYVELWSVTRFPNWKLTFRNVGIGGDTSPGGNSRFKRDVLAFHPTAMTVDFGMNDGGYGGFDEGRFRRYLDGLQGIANQAHKTNLRVAWITPQPTERREPGAQLTAYNRTLEKFSAGVKEIAQKNGGLFVDQFHPYLAVMEKTRAQNPTTTIMGGDAVHPGPPGQTVMAWAILKGLHFPRMVSSVEVDLKDATPKTVNCQVAQFSMKRQQGSPETYVAFQRKDEALPFFPASAKSILSRAPILEDLNDYRLKVVGLAPGRYEIRLGGQKVADYTAEELAKGVNLAGAALSMGPVAEQVSAVVKAVEEKNRYFHDRIFRGVILADVRVPDWLDARFTPMEINRLRKEAFSKRMERMPALDEAVREALRPRWHQVEIVQAEKMK